MSYKPETTSVFILAAGLGKRMRPLTNHTPKPLLKIKNKCLIEYHLENISKLGFKDVVINVAYLGQKIRNHLGNGVQFGLNIKYSDESKTGALETAGGIRQALNLIKHPQFVCLNADIWTDFDFSSLLVNQRNFDNQKKALSKIVLVKNPSHNPSGDFIFDRNTQLVERIPKNKVPANSFTFSGVGLYQKECFSTLPKKKQALGPILRNWADNKQLIGVIHTGQWQDIGTPERLRQLNTTLTNQT